MFTLSGSQAIMILNIDEPVLDLRGMDVNKPVNLSKGVTEA
jgi:hypothetical protein